MTSTVRTLLALSALSLGAGSDDLTREYAPFADRTRPVIALVSLSLSDTSVVGGRSSTATVRLDADAPEGGITVSIIGPRSTVVDLPSSVTVPFKLRQASFTVTTSPTTTTQGLVITATSHGVEKSATLHVRRPVLESLTLSRPFVQGGRDAFTATLVLDGVAPAGGIPVPISSSPAEMVFVHDPNPVDFIGAPEAVVVAGAREVVMNLRTRAQRTTRTVTVNSSTGATTRTATLEIRQPAVSSLQVRTSCEESADVLSQPISGPRTLRGRATVVGPLAPEGAFVSAMATAPAAVHPTMVEITQTGMSLVSGISYFDCFDITIPPVTAPTPVTIAAAAGGQTQTVSFTIVPLTLSSVEIASELARTGQAVSAAIRLSAPAPPEGVDVSLTVSNPAAATLPASVRVQGNARSVSVPFQVTIPAGHTDLATGVIITATFAGRSFADTVIIRR